MRKLLVSVLLMIGALLLGSVVGVTADPFTPGVWADPDHFQRYSYTDIHIRAAALSGGTDIAGIAIRKYDSATWWILEDGSGNNVTISLPDQNDEVRVRFGAGGPNPTEVAEVNDVGTDNIDIDPDPPGPYYWVSTPPSPLDQNRYVVQLYFREDGMIEYEIGAATYFFAIPEVPLGVAAALVASLAGLGLRRFRRKY